MALFHSLLKVAPLKNSKTHDQPPPPNLVDWHIVCVMSPLNCWADVPGSADAPVAAQANSRGRDTLVGHREPERQREGDCTNSGAVAEGGYRQPSVPRNSLLRNGMVEVLAGRKRWHEKGPGPLHWPPASHRLRHWYACNWTQASGSRETKVAF